MGIFDRRPPDEYDLYREYDGDGYESNDGCEGYEKRGSAAEVLLYPLMSIPFWVVFAAVTAGAKYSVTRLIANGYIDISGLSYYRAKLWDLVPLLFGAAVYVCFAVYGRLSKKSFRGFEMREVSESLGDAAAKTLTNKIFWLAWALTAAAMDYCFDWGALGNGVWCAALFLLFTESRLRGRRRSKRSEGK